MRSISYRAALVVGFVGIVGGAASWGAGPPNNDVSDALSNTAGGTDALVNNTGSYNTAFGAGALHSNTTGNKNTATGTGALVANIDGSNNTATGSGALFSNNGGVENTATGSDALSVNTAGSGNTATGYRSLFFNTKGSDNTATGYLALFRNTTGHLNMASGAWALVANTTGFGNSASGAEALFHNTSGNFNTTSGAWALVANTTGFENTALGTGALVANTTGFENLAVGHWAGSKLTSGDQNIYLGHEGTETESNTMRLGQAQTATFIAGVTGTPIVGNTVLINSEGQVGMMVSSARYKQDVEPLGEQGQKLQQLRAVSFHYKHVPQGPVQYGLIAEEVAQVYPELVTRNAKGEIEGIRYEELTPLLLNELQHQQQAQARQQQEILALQAQNDQLQGALAQQNAAVAVRLERLEEAARAATLASR